jgi:hypothetical protein
MGLVELPFGRIPDAEPRKFKSHRFNDYEGESKHGS